MEHITYKPRYTAFLDLLGFKTMVAQSATDPAVLDNINQALNYIVSIQNDNYNGTFSMVELGKQVTVFSDSIVISYDADMPGGGFYVLMDLVYICNSLLGIGIPVRGGVTVGDLIHDGPKCFGPAMVKAYVMESKEAIYPRVLIDESVIQYDLSRPGEANTVEYEIKYLGKIIQQDSCDKQLFLDYLCQCDEFDEFTDYSGYMLKTKEFIINNLKQYQGDKKLRKKYKWLKKYYNKTVKKVYSNFEPYYIREDDII